MSRQSHLPRRLHLFLGISLALGISTPQAQALDISFLPEFFLDNRANDVIFGTNGVRIQLGATVTDPKGVPENIQGVVARHTTTNNTYNLPFASLSNPVGVIGPTPPDPTRGFYGIFPPVESVPPADRIGYYQITATNRDGAVASTFFDPEIDFSRTKTIPLAIPKGPKLFGDALAPTVEWNRISGATGYQLRVYDSTTRQEIYSSPIFADPKVKVPPGVLSLDGDYTVSPRALDQPFELERRSVYFLPYSAPSPRQSSAPEFKGTLLINGKENGLLLPDRPTVVLVHGWQPTVKPLDETPSGPEWLEMASQRIADNYENVNVVSVVWKDAFVINLVSASKSTAETAQVLVETLLERGIDRSSAVHFVGHSLGSYVSREAAFLLGQNQIRVDHVSILDRPLARVILPQEDYVFGQRLRSVTYVDNFWNVDVTATGLPLFLAYNLALPFVNNPIFGTAHSQVSREYASSIGRSVGPFSWSVVGGGFDSRPAPQREIFVGAVESYVDFVYAVGDQYVGAINLAGEKLLDSVEFVKETGETTWRVLNGAVGSVFEMFDSTPRECLVTGPAAASSCAVLREGSSAYLWNTDFKLHDDAEFLMFDFAWFDSGDGDWITVHFEDTLLYSFLGGAALAEAQMSSGAIPLGDLAGQEGELLFTLNSAGERNAEVHLGNLGLYAWDVTASPLVVAADVDIDPRSLNRRSRGGPVIAYISLPSCCSIYDIDPTTVKLTKVNGEPLNTELAAFRSDVQGSNLLMGQFSRQALISQLASYSPGDVELTIEGKLKDGTVFFAADTIYVFN